MRDFARFLAADLMLLRKTAFFAFHLLIPAAGILIFLFYLSASGYDPTELTSFYLSFLALSFPLIAALLSALVANQEIGAGGGFFLLVACSRNKALLSKLLFCALGALLSSLLAVLGYGLLAPIVALGYSPDLALLAQAALILWSSSLFFYLFHFWVTLRRGQNLSYGLAAMEVMLCALMLTGIGDVIWVALPSGWNVRFLSYFGYSTIGSGVSETPHEIVVGIVIAIVATAFMFIFLLRFIRKWEGAQNVE